MSRYKKRERGGIHKMEGKDLHFNHQPKRGRRSNTNFPKSNITNYIRLETHYISYSKERQEEETGGPVCRLLHAGRLGRRRTCGIQREYVKPLVGKRYRNLTKGRETAVWQVQIRR